MLTNQPCSQTHAATAVINSTKDLTGVFYSDIPLLVENKNSELNKS
ncbi:hypothetical protein O9993_19865 [Vibrio lentus]|nr:hypothetical protein [Vibrio lentus]